MGQGTNEVESSFEVQSTSSREVSEEFKKAMQLLHWLVQISFADACKAQSDRNRFGLSHTSFLLEVNDVRSSKAV